MSGVRRELARAVYAVADHRLPAQGEGFPQAGGHESPGDDQFPADGDHFSLDVDRFMVNVDHFLLALDHLLVDAGHFSVARE